MKVREKILEEIRKIEEDDIMQQPKALVQINAPMALIQCTHEGQIQGLKIALKLLEEEEERVQTPERRFEGWSIFCAYSAPAILTDRSYLLATIGRDDLRNDKGYRAYVAHHAIDRGATEGNNSEVIMEEHFDDLISALLRLEDIDIKKYLNKVEPCTR